MPRQHTAGAVGKETLQIEKATSARSRCAPKLGGCGQKIELHSLRIKLSIRQDASRHYCHFKYFFHPKCYFELSQTQNKQIRMTDLKGSETLSNQQQTLLQNAINGQNIDWARLGYGNVSLNKFLSLNKRKQIKSIKQREKRVTFMTNRITVKSESNDDSTSASDCDFDISNLDQFKFEIPVITEFDFATPIHTHVTLPLRENQFKSETVHITTDRVPSKENETNKKIIKNENQFKTETVDVRVDTVPSKENETNKKIIKNENQFKTETVDVRVDTVPSKEKQSVKQMMKRDNNLNLKLKKPQDGTHSDESYDWLSVCGKIVRLLNGKSGLMYISVKRRGKRVTIEQEIANDTQKLPNKASNTVISNDVNIVQCKELFNTYVAAQYATDVFQRFINNGCFVLTDT
eukprot:380141_1